MLYQMTKWATAQFALASVCNKTLYLMSNVLDVREFQDCLEYVVESVDQTAGQHVLAAIGSIYDINHNGFEKFI